MADEYIPHHTSHQRETLMPTILHYCDDSSIAKIIQYLVRDLTQGAYHVETIPTAHPETAIAEYTNTEIVPIVMIEYPQDVAATIEQLHKHHQFRNAKVVIITSKPQLYQSLMSDTVAIGDKLDRVPMLRSFLSENNGA